MQFESDKKYGSYAKWRRTQGLVSRAIKQLIQIKKANPLEPSTSFENGPSFRYAELLKGNVNENKETETCQFLIITDLGKPKIQPYKTDFSSKAVINFYLKNFIFSYLLMLI